MIRVMEGRTTSQGTACSNDPFFISADAGAPDRRSTGNGRQRNVADMGITPATEEGHMIINGQQEDIATTAQRRRTHRAQGP